MALDHAHQRKGLGIADIPPRHCQVGRRRWGQQRRYWQWWSIYRFAHTRHVFVSFSFLISALYLLPPLSLSISICLLVVPCPAQESFTFTTSLLRISFPLADGMMRSRGQAILSTPHSAPYFFLRLDGLYSHLSFLPFFVRLLSFIKMVPDPTLAFAVLLS